MDQDRERYRYKTKLKIPLYADTLNHEISQIISDDENKENDHLKISNEPSWVEFILYVMASCNRAVFVFFYLKSIVYLLLLNKSSVADLHINVIN